MKPIRIVVLIAVALTTGNGFVFAQGSLTPAGPPAPTMKTLQQVEPHTPINNATAVTISASGSYYLTSNITVATGNAITIAANNVRLNLNGFTVSSTALSANGTGILLSGERADIHILNGHVRGTVAYGGGVYTGGGFASGIAPTDTSFSSAKRNVRVTGVSVSGCMLHGIYLSGYSQSIVESCTIQTVGNYGIDAVTVSDSTAYQCGSTAIRAGSASGCYAYCTGNAYGLVAATAINCYGEGISGLDATTARNCHGYGRSGDGLVAHTAINCIGSSSGSGYGLSVSRAAIGCYGSSAGGIGIGAFIANSCRGIGPTPVLATHKYDMP